MVTFMNLKTYPPVPSGLARPEGANDDTTICSRQRINLSLLSSHTLIQLPLAMLGLFALAAQADELDTLQFKASESVQHDSNVYRLSDSADAQALIGTPARSDTTVVTTVGFKLNKPYSLQRFELAVNVEDHRYRRFSNLNFTAVNYSASWRWSFTPALHGNLTTDRQETVDKYADVQNTGALNRRTSRSTVLDAEYELGGAWRLVGGVFQRSNTNSQPFTFEGNSRVNGAEAGVRYVFRSDTSVAYRFRNGSGENAGLLPLLGFAGNFKDKEHEFRLDWAPTGKTSVQARMSQFDRSFNGFPARNFSGVIGELNGSWAVTGKTSITGGLVRDLGSYQTSTDSYYQGYRLFVAPLWKATEKIALRARYDYGVREYKGPLPGFASSSRQDTTDLTTLALEWQPLRALKLTASIQRDKRKSNLPGFDYVSNSVGLTALASF